MTIISIITAFALCHFIRELGALRRYEWMGAWARFGGDHLSGLPGWNGVTGFFVLLATPLLALALLNGLLTALLGVIGAFLLALAVLVHCFGPRDLDTDVNAVLGAGDDGARDEALATLLGGPVPDDEDICRRRAIEAVFREALRRWFAVIFWFALLGIHGALLYRMAAWLRDGDFGFDDELRALLARLAQVMEWPVAQLMTLSLAIATDFDSVAKAWRRYHEDRGHGLFDAENGFLLTSARHVVLSGGAARDGYADQLTGPQAALQLSMDLVWRILAVWMFVLALLLLVDVIA